jgi:hypothetical protein
MAMAMGDVGEALGVADDVGGCVRRRERRRREGQRGTEAEGSGRTAGSEPEAGGMR